MVKPVSRSTHVTHPSMKLTASHVTTETSLIKTTTEAFLSQKIHPHSYISLNTATMQDISGIAKKNLSKKSW